MHATAAPPRPPQERPTEVGALRPRWVLRVLVVAAAVFVGAVALMLWPAADPEAVRAAPPAAPSPEPAPPESDARLQPFDPVPEGFFFVGAWSAERGTPDEMQFLHYATDEIFPLHTPVGEGRHDLRVSAGFGPGANPGPTDTITRQELELIRTTVRGVYVARGGWRIYVTTTAPEDLLSDEEFLALADRVVLD